MGAAAREHYIIRPPAARGRLGRAVCQGDGCDRAPVDVERIEEVALSTSRPALGWKPRYGLAILSILQDDPPSAFFARLKLSPSGGSNASGRRCLGPGCPR